MIDPEFFELTEEQRSDRSELRGRSAPGKASSHRTRTRYPQSPGTSRAVTAPAVNGPTFAGERAPQTSAELPPQSGIEREFAERQALESALQAQSEFWRQEVVRRVEGYRTRRSRKRLAGQFSMRLDFEASVATGSAQDSLTITVSGSTQSFSAVTEAEEASAPGSVSPERGPEPAASSDEIPGSVLESASRMEEQLTPEPSSPSPAAVTGQAKLVEFPRSLVFPEFPEPDPHALGEPVVEKLRILDVPEAIGVAPAPLSDIALQPKEDEEEDLTPPAAFELPLQVAPMRVRFAAGLIDTLLVVVGAAMFVMLVGQTTTGLAPNRTTLMLAVVAAEAFWAVYHYLFLVHAGATPGMVMAQVRLSTFAGYYAPRRLRRWRALIMVLSFAALGFGFLWALFDQDNLCWHDKMTRTYLTADS